MTRYNHEFDIAFKVISNEEDGSDVTADMLKDALKKRIESLKGNDIVEFCDCRYYSYEMDDDDD